MTTHEPATNVISFDVEHWHSATLLDSEVQDPVDHIENSVSIVLDLLRRHDVSATFFVIGEIAEEHPDLVREIHDDGHEVASHGYTHTPLTDLTPGEFEAELRRCRDTIERVIGRKPVGFRAANFSICRETGWAFRVLESNGYRYDSSVFPTKTPLYGVSGAPVRPYEATVDDPFRVRPDGDGDSLVEFPVSVMDWRFRVPIAGGFYARLLPTVFLTYGIGKLNSRGIPANLYFHPWEFNPDVPFDGLPFHKRFISFYGVETLQQKLEELFERFEFGTMRETIEELGLVRPEEFTVTEPIEQD